MTITITTGVQSAVPGADGELGNTVYPSISALTNGDYVVTWITNDGAFGQLYNANGATVGGDFQIDTPPTDGYPDSPVLNYPATAAPLAGGGFVVTWTESVGVQGPIYAQRFDGAGNKVGVQTQVSSNAVDGGRDQGSMVTALAGGGYVVAWSSDGDNNQNIYHTYAQQYDASGNQVGGEFEVGDDPTRNQIAGGISALAGGGYVITWGSSPVAGAIVTDLYAQRYDASGNTVGGATLVMADAQGGSVAALANGGYVVAWQNDSGGAAWDIYEQAYNSSGAAVGSPVLVNTTTAGNQTGPIVVSTQGGGWFVAWTSDQSSGGIYGQAFDANGNKVGGETLLPLASGGESHPAVTVLTDGQIALAWAALDANGDSSVVQKLNGASVVSPNLTSAVETAVGDGANDTFLAAPGTINPGDKIDGGGGTNTLQLTAPQTANFTGVTIANVQQIVGSSGNDELIFPNGPPSGVTFVTGGGSDTLALGGHVDLSTLSLSGNWTLAPAPGLFADFKLTSLSQISEISGAGGDLTVDASAFTLTSAQRTQLLNQGVSDILDGSITYRDGASILITLPQVQITTTTSSAAVVPEIAPLSNGDMVAVYEVQPSPASANGPAIAFQLLDAGGNPIGGAVAVDSNATQDQLAQVAALSGGGFVVTWQGSDPTQGFANSNYLQAYDNQGDKVGGLVTLTTNTAPHVAALTGGGYVVEGQSNTGSVGFQEFSAAGALVASGTPGTTTSGAASVVAGLPSGGFVVAWSRPNAEIDLQIYSAAGAAVGGVETAVSGQVGGVTTAGLSGGGFVLTWSEFSFTDHGWDIYAERFDASGVAQGGVTQVNVSDGNQVGAPQIAATSDGGYIITWQEESPTGTNPTDYAQLYNSAGAQVGPAFTFGTSATGNGVGGATVAGLSRGGYVLAYTGQGFGVTQVLASVTQGVDGILTTGVDTFNGGNSNLLVVTPAGGLNAGDVVTGGTGQNELEMTSAGVLDFTAPTTFSGFQTIAGSSGNDTFIFSTARLAGVTAIDGGGGTNNIVATDAHLNLGGVTLTNIQALSTNFAGGTDFNVPSSAGSLSITGGAGFDQVDFSAAAASATLKHNADGTWTATLAGGQHDVLTGVELVQFSDRDVSLVARWANRGDFLGHAASDFLIQNGVGAVVVGEAHGGQAAFSAVSGLGSDWSFRGDGDFVGDGASDYLIENGAGAVVVGEVAGGQAAYTQVAALGPEWKFVGTGNYLGDAKSDFLVENSSGAVVVGEVTGGHTAYTQVAALGPEWKFEGSGDFLGDGKDEFLIQNGVGAVVAGEVVNGQAAYTSLVGLGPEWKFVGTGDFLGEGHSQFLIENANGAVDVGDWANGQIHFTQVAGLGPEWTFVGAGDYLGEGHDQFLIENTAGAVDVGDWVNGSIHFTQIAGLGPEWAFH